MQHMQIENVFFKFIQLTEIERGLIFKNFEMPEDYFRY